MSDHDARIKRITRDVRLRAYPPAPDPKEPLVIGRYNPPSPVIVMRADFVALAEELAKVKTLEAEVTSLRQRVAELVAANQTHDDAIREEAEARGYQRGLSDSEERLKAEWVRQMRSATTLGMTREKTDDEILAHPTLQKLLRALATTPDKKGRAP